MSLEKIDFIEKYKIADSRSSFKKDKVWENGKSKTIFGYIGYRTKSAYYILSPWCLEKNPSCRITKSHGAKCFACGMFVPLRRLKKILNKGWIKSWNARNLSVDKFEKMYKDSRYVVELKKSMSENPSDIPF